ncbi:MAG: AGE family epimerase/isomerase [Eubacteriales bacterium]|nr:AGE family epimerase/isomerase [Eubacteriales bacterium]MDD4475958.1 AGE family epimerase/isomerase [Eubacteriales bacterium]
MKKQTYESFRQYYKDKLLEDSIPFWLQSDLIDKKYGGYISSVDRYGKSYNDDKSVWFQGRCLWTFSALCNRYGKTDEWMKAAEAGVDFLEEKCIDTDGRMFFQVTREGKPLRKRRYMFSESFYVVSMAEYALMTGKKEYLKKAEECFELMLRMFYDSSSDPYKITPKSYAETRSERAASVPMVLISSAQVLRRCDPDKAEYYSKVADEMAEVIINCHYKPELQCVLETVAQDGSKIDTPAGRTVNPGHSMENAWFLMNHVIHTGNKELLQKALNILDWSLELGWDDMFGGFVYFIDIDGKPCEQLEHDMKLWWVHNEALIATLMAHLLTGEKKYWDWFVRIHDYSFGHFQDNEYGDWYGYLHRDGTVSHTQKGSMWKGPFHHPRCLMICEELLGMLSEGKKPSVVL